LDNMDGLAAGVSATAAAYFTVIAALNGQFMVSILAAAILGACLGFLFYNSRPATVFMGDAGSLCLGILLAALGIKLKFPDASNVVTWMVPVMVLGVPVFDTTLVTVSRLRKGKNPLKTPGQDHLSHRLTARGCTTLEAVLLHYLLGAGFGLLAIYLMQAGIAEGYQAGATVLLLLIWLIWRLDRTFEPTA
ncbi:MAG: MraY family glycosyltransferase, partial [Verrucomicrobiota bacterium]